METVIQFIGLCLFTAAVSNEPGVHVIMPRVAAPKSALASLNPTISALNVEEHTVIIAFRKSAYVPGKWKPSVLKGTPADDQFLYIVLNGERVTFSAKGFNAPLDPKGAELRDLGLPHVRDCACKSQKARMKSLRKEYRWPYLGSAAVADLTFGRFDTCYATNQAESGRRRIDTRLFVNLDEHVLTITVKPLVGGAKKAITLRDPDLVVVANIPKRWVNGDHSIDVTHNLAHYAVYYAMGDGDSKYCSALENCDGPKTTESCRNPEFLPKHPDPTPPTPVPNSAFHRMSAAQAPRLDPTLIPPTPEAFMDFQCSNTTWP
jgi:hypothetical protein